ncbi:PREDICTED: probable 28S ribosomal protein S26, mitochondrial [Dufourea novaeangliae]|uniref:Small ribosomal subunit protein mS26 n=1 Tax=Dufourea novaeangliae TaxID=178035 RepID=A0A154P9N5_DUFNO|nr:PREDICTED: probable 28S ribosomal protein S26, mitochondrial [Dufourea novaeangliae]KZC08605.1 putative 28S ribosomal protein S26, mitochondrial [Dufourea novaeangliae]
MIRASAIMGSTALTIRNLSGHDHLISYGPCIQYVRWKRKPLWLSTAKTKVFRVPQRPVTSQEEFEKIKCLYNNYRTSIKSIRSFLINKEAANQVQYDTASIKILANEDFIKCNEINEDWNKQVAAERQQRLAAEREKRIEDIQMKLEAKKERDLLLQAKVDAEIRKAKEEASSFITRDNIDEAIKEALYTIVDHNAAIDLDGTFYKEEHNANTTV